MEAVSAKEPEKDGEYEKYELESCADTLMRAEEIKADAKKMAALQPFLDKKVKALQGITSIKDLKEVAKKKAKV